LGQQVGDWRNLDSQARRWRWIEQEDEVERVEERFCLRTRDAERRRGATDGTDGGRLVGRGSSVDRHSLFVRQLVLHFSSKASADGVCSRAQLHRSPSPLSQGTLRTSPDAYDGVLMALAKWQVAAPSPSLRTGGWRPASSPHLRCAPRSPAPPAAQRVNHQMN